MQSGQSQLLLYSLPSLLFGPSLFSNCYHRQTSSLTFPFYSPITRSRFIDRLI